MKHPTTGPMRPRGARFSATSAGLQAWLGRDQASAILYGALSTIFPDGERFFIDSVRMNRSHALAIHAPSVDAFVRQEANHTREHAALNRAFAAAGFDLAPLQVRTARELDRIRQRSPMRQLILTVSLEHLTAVFAHSLLANPEHLAPASEEERRLWKWHAIEEIDHKAVAFDLFVAASAQWNSLSRWLFRSASMAEATWLFAKVMRLNIEDLVKQSGQSPMRMWADLGRLCFTRPGLVREMAPALCAYYLPGFHPWQTDDAALMRRESLAEGYA